MVSGVQQPVEGPLTPFQTVEAGVLGAGSSSTPVRPPSFAPSRLTQRRATVHHGSRGTSSSRSMLSSALAPNRSALTRSTGSQPPRITTQAGLHSAEEP